MLGGYNLFNTYICWQVHPENHKSFIHLMHRRTSIVYFFIYLFLGEGGHSAAEDERKKISCKSPRIVKFTHFF